MKFPSNDHIYRVAPPVLGNDVSDDPCVIRLRGITQEEFDAAVAADAEDRMTYTQDEAMRRSTERTRKLISDHFAGVENLTVGDTEIKAWDEFYRLAPRELVSWVVSAVYQTDILLENERKN